MYRARARYNSIALQHFKQFNVSRDVKKRSVAHENQSVLESRMNKSRDQMFFSRRDIIARLNTCIHVFPETVLLLSLPPLFTHRSRYRGNASFWRTRSPAEMKNDCKQVITRLPTPRGFVYVLCVPLNCRVRGTIKPV